jgi:putative ABC transport system permease protein
MTRVIPDDLYRVGEIAVDAPALSFTLGLCLLTTVVFGLAPALQASRPNLNETLKEGGSVSGLGFRRRRLHSVLVVGEIGLSLVLLVGAALMLQSFAQLQRVNVGFVSKSVLTMKLILPEARYSGAQQRGAFHRQVIQEAQRVPGVLSAATVDFLPLNHETNETEFEIEGRPRDAAGSSLLASTLWISPDYFQVMGIPVLKGRPFTEQDDQNNLPGVIINQVLAERFFANEDPVGRRLVLKGRRGEDHLASILGVVGNTKHSELSEESEMQIYRPQFQMPDRYLRLVVKTATDPLTPVPSLRQAVWAVDQGLPITEIRTLDQVVEEFLLPQRSLAITLVIVAASALILATVGIYGVMSYLVSRRTHEVGIRLALGAEQRDVLKLILGRGMKLASIGIGIGLAAALALTQLMASLLVGVSATDPVTFVGVCVLLASAALLACYIPARRAMRVDPMVALRYE